MNKWILVGFVFLGSLSAMASSGKEMPPVQTVAKVDLSKYVGTWYEIASIPQWFQKKCVANSTAEYSIESESLIKVINSCDTQSGERDVAEARAKVVDSVTNSKLRVTFVKFIGWIFAFGGNYWILDLEPNYAYAVVGDPTRDYAWILSRTPKLSQEQIDLIEKNLKAQGYDTCRLLTTVQNGGFADRRPLCEVVKNWPL